MELKGLLNHPVFNSNYVDPPLVKANLLIINAKEADNYGL